MRALAKGNREDFARHTGVSMRTIRARFTSRRSGATGSRSGACVRGALGVASLMACSLSAPKAAAERAGRDAEPRLEERTAFTIGAQRLKLGLLAFEYGIVDRLSIGTDPPAWAARAVLPIFVPNVHAELIAIDSAPFVASARVGAYYADLKGGGDASGSLIAVPASLFASLRLSSRWWLHGEAAYVWADASGTGDLDNADLNGAVATRVAQLGALLEWRLTRVVSLTALGRAEVYSGPLIFRGTTSPDDRTIIDIEAELSPRSSKPWQAVGGAAFTWEHVRLSFGLGYGNYFIPGAYFAMPSRGIVPDLSLAVVL